MAIMPYKEFTKPELQEIASEIGITFDDDVVTVRLAKLIHDDLDKNGVPPEEDCSELFDEYLFTCGYIDDEGNVTDFADLDISWGDEWKINDKLEDDTAEVDTIEQDVQITDDLVIINGDEHLKPDCYTLADQKDPACRQCVVLQWCLVARMESRPHCFGQAKWFNANSEECQACIEFQPCGQTVKERRK